MLDTPPRTSVFGHLRVKAAQLTQGEGYGRALDLSEGQGHIPYMEIHVLLRVKVDHLTTLTPDIVSFILISTLYEATSNLYQPYSAHYISKFIEKCNEKKLLEIKRKTVSSVGTGKENFT